MAACGGDSGESEEERIMGAVEQSYALATDGRWDDLWNTYTSAYQERCSFDAMVELFEELRDQGVTRFEVTAFDEIEFIGDVGQARYSVAGFDESGEQTASYSYDTNLVKEDGEWRFEGICY